MTDGLEGALKELTPEERLKERQASIKPLVEEFFSWLRKIQADRSVLPKSETAKGINYCLNQEEYLKVFLSDGLNVYYYMKYLLTELTQAVRADGSIDEKDLTFTQLIRSATFVKEAIWKVLRIFQILWQIYHKCIRRMYVSGDYVLHCPPNMALVSV